MSFVWNSFADLSRLQRDLERSLGAHPAESELVPPLDVREDAEAFFLELDLPGVKREDLELSVDHDVLTLTARAKRPVLAEGARYHRAERRAGSYARKFRVPSTVDAAAIDATLADGVLTLRLPKKPEVKARTIEIKAN